MKWIRTAVHWTLALRWASFASVCMCFHRFYRFAKAALRTDVFFFLFYFFFTFLVLGFCFCVDSYVLYSTNDKHRSKCIRFRLIEREIVCGCIIYEVSYVPYSIPVEFSGFNTIQRIDTSIYIYICICINLKLEWSIDIYILKFLLNLMASQTIQFNRKI